MPPAFNLSQDQTLQFNLCARYSARRLLAEMIPTPTGVGFDSREHLMLLPAIRRYCERWIVALAAKRPHLSAVSVFKERTANAKILCVSSEEARL